MNSIRITIYDGVENVKPDVVINEPCWVCGEPVTQAVVFEDIDDGCMDAQVCDKCIIKIAGKLKELKP